MYEMKVFLDEESGDSWVTIPTRHKPRIKLRPWSRWLRFKSHEGDPVAIRKSVVRSIIVRKI